MGIDGEEDHDKTEDRDMDALPAFSFTDAPEQLGTQIGGYKLLSVLGEGGLGIVYRAEQKQPVRRQVALKIIKPGMDSKQVIARFETERQALALLDHPNIARIFDAGTTQKGRPYFVMEMVRGLPITEYCDQHKLGIEDRLGLFSLVCGAVQHAHQKGIIHRDIKPSNILVPVRGGKPAPVIIDFGVAKAISQPLTEKTLFTEQGQLIGTPEYMSPEQAGMAPEYVDTRSDVYSLGVVLYELLTGRLPFDSQALREAAFAEVIRIIQEEEPPRPSARLSSLGDGAEEVAEKRRTQVVTLVKRLHNELEWIPLKAMRKEADHRYRTASDLADDVQNYLKGAPLIAGPESKLYRAKKFVRRNRVLVTSVTAIAVVLIAGIVISTMFGVQAHRAKILAEQKEKEEATQRQLTEKERNRAIEAEKVAESDRDRAETEAEAHRRALYVNRINLADKYYRESDVKRARELLVACPNDLRGWEWYYLRRILDQARITLRGHEHYVSAVAFSPDGKWIVSGSRDKTLKIWDADSGGEVMTLRGHESSVSSVAFSPDGKRIVSGSEDNTLKVWDVESGGEVMTLRGHEHYVLAVAFSPDGKRIVSGSRDKTLKIWDADSGGEVMTLRGHDYTVMSVAFSPDGKRIISGSSDHTLKVWDAKSGVEVMTLRGHRLSVLSVAFSPDGKRIVSGSWDKTLKVWDANSGGEVMTLRGHEYTVMSVAFSPDGRRIVSGGYDKTVKVWDANSGAEVMTLRGHVDAVYAVAFSPDGKRIIAGYGGYGGGVLVFFDAAGHSKVEAEIWIH